MIHLQEELPGGVAQAQQVLCRQTGIRQPPPPPRLVPAAPPLALPAGPRHGPPRPPAHSQRPRAPRTGGQSHGGGGGRRAGVTFLIIWGPWHALADDFCFSPSDPPGPALARGPRRPRPPPGGRISGSSGQNRWGLPPPLQDIHRRCLWTPPSLGLPPDRSPQGCRGEGKDSALHFSLSSHLRQGGEHLREVGAQPAGGPL